ncbi:MAG: hypothetical protein R8M45_04570, partial [Ghiorsea sp.]
DTIVGNDTSNVIVKSNDPLEAFNVHNPVLLFDTLSAASDNKFIAINTSFRGLGTGGYRKYGLSFSGDPSRFEVVANPYRGLRLEGCAFANNGIDIALLRYGGIFNNNLHTNYTSDYLYGMGKAFEGRMGNKFLISNMTQISQTNGLAGGTFEIEGMLVANITTWLGAFYGASYIANATIHGVYALHSLATGSLPIELRDSVIRNFAFVISFSGYGQSAYANLRLKDCVFDEPNSRYISTINGAAAFDVQLEIVNKNLDPLIQQVYSTRGFAERDNVMFKNGSSSQKIAPSDVATPFAKAWSVIAPNAVPVTATGFLRKDAAFNGEVVLTMSGMGSTPVTWTHSFAAADAWELWSLASSHNAGADGVFTLSASVTGTAGMVWFDQIAAPAAVAVDTGAMGFYENGSAMSALVSNFVTANDLWASQIADVQTPNSMGEYLAQQFTITNIGMDEHLGEHAQAVCVSALCGKSINVGVYRHDTGVQVGVTAVMTELLPEVYTYTIDWATIDNGSPAA